MQALHEAGANVMMKAANGFSALTYAAASGHVSTITALLDLGPQTVTLLRAEDNAGRTPLAVATECEQPNAVRALEAALARHPPPVGHPAEGEEAMAASDNATAASEKEEMAIEAIAMDSRAKAVATEAAATEAAATEAAATEAAATEAAAAEAAAAEAAAAEAAVAEAAAAEAAEAAAAKAAVAEAAVAGGKAKAGARAATEAKATAETWPTEATVATAAAEKLVNEVMAIAMADKPTPTAASTASARVVKLALTASTPSLPAASALVVRLALTASMPSLLPATPLPAMPSSSAAEATSLPAERCDSPGSEGGSSEGARETGAGHEMVVEEAGAAQAMPLEKGAAARGDSTNPKVNGEELAGGSGSPLSKRGPRKAPDEAELVELRSLLGK